MSISGLRFGHVAFKVSDVERSLRWYGNAFGAKMIYHGEARTTQDLAHSTNSVPGG